MNDNENEKTNQKWCKGTQKQTNYIQNQTRTETKPKSGATVALFTRTPTDTYNQTHTHTHTHTHKHLFLDQFVTCEKFNVLDVKL